MKFSEKEFGKYVLDYMVCLYEAQKQGDAETPTLFGFWRWLDERKQCSFHTVRRCFDEYWADMKKEFNELRADLLVNGGAKGVYNVTMVIFALKNWCGWKDRKEQSVEVSGNMSLESKLKALEGDKF
ncbi:hypothetical protein A5N82_13330 [Christensenella minuta]|uniref:Uncharacterized protein n=2 Tax=Christensenella minuta TaxID=626937 RepID=A0A136Q8N8_9FIRM|nr:hypothetical protein B1H56_14405 [Christensenella minuta]KXK67040.1 hypothetical protein HMPREF3293_00107 [Christensenella minuta]OAQ39031.1 hypothetical protein A5N82_13330 [Christensenella minuta]